MQGSVFFTKTYDEAVSLVEDAREYFEGPGAGFTATLEPVDSLAYSAETLKLTTLLTEAMAWLTILRARHEGTLDAEFLFTEEYRLGNDETCLAEPLIDHEKLPRQMRELLRRSELLYRRLARLDAMIREEADLYTMPG
ncbi:DUF1465 family protein [Oceanibacterium hippocampi]|uniref:Uncharacterized protein n=1 Tax=Oceanibacterium hippocampi TaxID=745714 RepID=A0A1Y5TUV0_9PROT|nr:DUF1465 family protein [Oceanibacterium hippocampi]SLN73536.1 hypothetical protein OCH7691_03619 [Oceanibacterium hippocampi]